MQPTRPISLESRDQSPLPCPRVNVPSRDIRILARGRQKTPGSRHFVDEDGEGRLGQTTSCRFALRNVRQEQRRGNRARDVELS